MSLTAEAFIGVISRSSLGEFDFRTEPVCEGEDPVFIVGPIPRERSSECRGVATGFLDETNRWPVWVDDIGFFEGGDPPFFYARQASSADSPAAIVERSLAADETEMLTRLGSYDMDSEIELLTRRHPRPSRDEIDEGVELGQIAVAGDVAKWVLDWRLRHLPEDQLKSQQYRNNYLDSWLDWPYGYVFFFPTRDPWRVTSFFEFSGGTEELSTFLLKRWFDRWDAKVVAHSLTMMSFEVGAPPKSRKEAGQVAWEHLLLSGDLSEDQLFEYADALIGHRRWFFHCKP